MQIRDLGGRLQNFDQNPSILRRKVARATPLD